MQMGCLECCGFGSEQVSAIFCCMIALCFFQSDAEFHENLHTYQQMGDVSNLLLGEFTLIAGTWVVLCNDTTSCFSKHTKGLCYWRRLFGCELKSTTCCKPSANPGSHTQ
jgi:hypothetical protein